MFITPAMASEPYWAAAPSRSTSIRSIAAAGIAFRSTPTVPRPNVPLTCTSAGGWRRLPLTSTSTWSGPRPRRLAGLMWSEPSAMVWCDALNDGASVARIWFTSVWPVSCTSWEVMTSTGTGVSTAVRDVRAPTTTISLRERGVAVSLKSTVTVCPAGTTTRSSAASCPMSRARTLCTPAGTLRRYCPFSLVRTLRAVPTTTTLAPTSGAPDSVATTVPETVPVCCANDGTTGATSKNATSSGRTGLDLTGHLLESLVIRLRRPVRYTVLPPVAWPIARTRASSASRSSFSIGSANSRSIRRLNNRNAASNACRCAASSPATSAGSGMPQCARIGWPGKMGHDSFARSHTVITKSQGPHERPHDPALRDLVDPRRLHTDLLEPGLRQQPLILGFLQRTGDAPHPQLHAAPYCGRHLPANDDIRHGEPAARSENAEGLAQHLTLIDREVDHAVRDDHVHRPIRERDVLDR